MTESLRATTRREVEAAAAGLVELSHTIHAHPELAFEEERSSRWVAEALSDAGLDVETGVCDLPTAFVATAGRGPLTVGICGGERAWLCFRARRRIGHRDCSLPRTCYCSVAPGIRDITAIHACSASRRGVDFVCNSLTESAPGVQAVSWMTTR